MGKDICNEYNWKRVSTWNLKISPAERKERRGRGGGGREGQVGKEGGKENKGYGQAIHRRESVYSQ